MLTGNAKRIAKQLCPRPLWTLARASYRRLFVPPPNSAPPHSLRVISTFEELDAELARAFRHLDQHGSHDLLVKDLNEFHFRVP